MSPRLSAHKAECGGVLGMQYSIAATASQNDASAARSVLAMWLSLKCLRRNPISLTLATVLTKLMFQILIHPRYISL
jgi:hypothetical protein